MEIRFAATAAAAMVVLTASAASGQTIKPVEVTNLPEVQAVEVVNPAPASCDQKRVQVVGVTSAAYDGDLGGPWGANRKCDAEFPGSFLCNDFGVIRDATSPPPASGAVAWVSGLSQTCGQWTSALPGDTGGQVDTSTGFMISGSPFLPCDDVRPLLCCGYR